MNVKYKVLATLSLQHDFYADGNCPDFSIVPAPETQTTLKNLGAVCKISGSKLLILIRADDAGKAFIPVPGDKSFVFYMICENQFFFNITNVTQQPVSHLRYYFTNRSNNQMTTDKLYLNQAPSIYSSDVAYEVGDLVVGESAVAEAIRSSDSLDPHNVADPEYWSYKPAAVQSYVNKNDITEFATPVYNFSLDTAATDVTIKIYAYKADSSSVQVGDTATQSYSTAQTSVVVSLDKLPAGYYKIDVNGQVKNIYLDANAVYRSVFGVVELFTVSDGSAFAMFDEDGTMLQPDFVLCFPARSVVWKYLTNETISGVAYGEYDFHYVLDEKSGMKSYVSNIPIPLVQEIAAADAPVKMRADESTETLAVPTADKLSFITQGGDTYYCIERYLAS